jgi:hypothetical protein
MQLESLIHAEPLLYAALDIAEDFPQAMIGAWP